MYKPGCDKGGQAPVICTYADFDLWFTYRRDSAATTMPMAVYLHHVDGSNHLLLEIQSAQARLIVGD